MQTIQGQVEEKWGVKLGTAHSIWPSLVEVRVFLGKKEVKWATTGKRRMNVAKSNEASSLARFSVKRFCGEDDKSEEI